MDKNHLLDSRQRQQRWFEARAQAVRPRVSAGRNLLVTLLISLAAAGTAAAEPQISFAYDGVSIYGTGEIDVNAAERLRALVKSRHVLAGTSVVLDSRGGNVFGGIRLGRAIRELKLDTSVARDSGEFLVFEYMKDGQPQRVQSDTHRMDPGECLSACVYSYVGGIRRYRPHGSRFGIHQFYFPKSGADGADGAAGDAQMLSATIVAHLRDMGISPLLFTATATFDKDQMRYLSDREAEDYRIVNNGVGRTKFTYGVSRGHPYPKLSHETEKGRFSLSLLCNGASVHVGVEREIGARNMLSAREDIYYMWFDEKPVFKMDQDRDTFEHVLDRAMLRKFLSSRRIGVWEEVGSRFHFDGTEFIVEDWQLFVDYLESCTGIDSLFPGASLPAEVGTRVVESGFEAGDDADVDGSGPGSGEAGG